MIKLRKLLKEESAPYYCPKCGAKVTPDNPFPCSHCLPPVQKESVGKRDYTPILMRMNNQDRKTIRYWNVREENDTVMIEFYSTLVGQGMLEYISELVERSRGEFRMIPDDNLICIQITVPRPKV